MAVQILFLLEILVATFALWLGLYATNRDLPWKHDAQPLWKRPPILTGAGLLLGSVYLYGNAMKMVATTPEEFARWQQFTLWGIPIAIALFLAAVVQLTYAGRPTPRWVYVLLVAVAVIAVSLAAGILSGFLFDSGSVRQGNTVYQPYYVPPRVRYAGIYYGFLIAGILGSIAVLLNRLPATAGDADRTEKVWVGIAAGALFLVGLLATYVFSELGHPNLPMQAGDLLAALGAVAVSYDIAKHNALKHRQIIRADFWHSLTSVAVTTLACMVIYAGIAMLFGYPVQPLAVLLISIFIVLTHTPYNWGDAVLDRLFLPRWVVGYRDQLLLMRQQPLTAEDPADSLSVAGEMFDAILEETRTKELEALISSEVDEIFKYANFRDDELLSRSRLLELQIGQIALHGYAQEHDLRSCNLTDHQRAECLRCLLRSAINEWSWSPETPSRRSRIEKSILIGKYIEQRSRVEVEHLLADQFDVVITGGGYSRRLKDARAHLTRVLHERELAY